MKWKIKHHNVGDIRVKKKFALFPKVYEIGDLCYIYWLENVYEKQEWVDISDFVTPCGEIDFEPAHWEFRRLITKEEYIEWQTENKEMENEYE